MNITSYKPFVRNPITSREDLALNVRLACATQSLKEQTGNKNVRHPGDWPAHTVRILRDSRGHELNLAEVPRLVWDF